MKGEILVFHMVDAAAVENVVQKIVGTDGGAVAVQRFAASVAAVAKIEVGKLLVLLLQVQNIALFHRFFPFPMDTAPYPRMLRPSGNSLLLIISSAY